MTPAPPELYAEIARRWEPASAALILWIFVLYLAVVGPVGRKLGHTKKVDLKRLLYFAGGLAAGFAAEASPLHVVSEEYLFSAHMLQHVLLTLVMPPLLILGTPPWVIDPLTRGVLGRVFRWVVSPIPALALFNATYTLWHLPLLYQAALYVHYIHIIEHIVMISTALIMWWPIAGNHPALPRMHDAVQVVYVFLMSVAQIGIFAVVTFAHDVFYAFYGAAPRLWGITPHQDQQLAGIVMKVGGMGVFIFALTRAFFRWAAREEALARPHAHSGQETLDGAP